MLYRRLPAAIFLIALSACAAPESGNLTPLRVFATSAAVPWLETAYDCTPEGIGIALARPDESDMVLRLTEPRPLTAHAFQVGADDLLVVAHSSAAVPQLTPEQVQRIFAGEVDNWREVGGADIDVLVWTYSPTVDVQAFFNRSILDDRPVTSMARLAVSAQDMADSVGSTPGSVGILPRRWTSGNTQEVLMVASVPVLALTQEAPRGALAELVACMQARQ